MRLFTLTICMVAVFCNNSALASLVGDPFADADVFSDVSELKVEKDPFKLGGYVEFRNQLGMNDLKKPVSIRQRLHLEAKWEKGALSFFSSMDADQELAAETWGGEGHRVRDIGIKEVYAMYDSDSMDFFVGRKIHRWGTSDGINPMDLINPLDILDPISTGRADNRVPVLMGAGILTLGNWTLEGVYLPRAEVCDLPRSGNPWEPRDLRLIRQQTQGNLVLNSAQKPDQWFSDSEFGGRIATTIDGWDIAALVFHGHADSPVLKTSVSGGKTTLIPEYLEYTAYGATFAKGMGSSTLRGELAWKRNYPYQDARTGLAVRNDLAQFVLGGDYNLDGKYYFNIQVFVDAYALDSSRSNWQHGFTYEISGKWADDTLTVGVRGKLHTDGEGALTELFADYDLTDSWKLRTGIMVWSGPRDGALGQYDDNDYIYATLRYSF